MQVDRGYVLVSALFVRLLALIYLIAFLSLAGQIDGLAGPEGVLPLQQTLDAAAASYGWRRFLVLPTLFWLDAGTPALLAATYAGGLVSILLVLNILPRLSLLVLFVLYLSLFHAGQIFMNFQWDYLLLEAGFLAIFLHPGSRGVIWLFRWLLFRLRFLSGVSKLLSQDPTWSGLTALSFYFETQPLPHWGAWYAHQLPEWMHQTGTALVLVIEVLVPFMMFLSRGPRFVAAWLTIGLQVLIILTSNHNWFNLLTLTLCLFLFDDQALRRVVPAPLERWLLGRPLAPIAAQPAAARAIVAALALLVVPVSAMQMWEMFSGERLPGPVGRYKAYVNQWHIANRYHVFPTIKTRRIELELQGSLDGKTWKTYEFRFKPGPLDRRPAFIVPRQPRLDWMMWFVPLGPDFLPWLDGLLQALLRASPPVLGLLEDPFDGRAPREVRVLVYDYHFTTPTQREHTGDWWTREYLGVFRPLPGLTREAAQP